MAIKWESGYRKSGTDLQNIYDPITIAGSEIPNGIWMSPMALGYAEDGRSTERLARFFEERPKGGVGLIDWALWPYRTEHGYFPWVFDDMPVLLKGGVAVGS